MTIEQIISIHGGKAEDWHQHENGGGWVQYTATVEKTAYVGPSARVYGAARVSGAAWVSGDARVYGDAWVSGAARVYGAAWNSSPLYIQGSVHPITVSSRTEVSVGCKKHSIGWWIDHYAEVGKGEGYTEAQIVEYGALLAAVKVWMEAKFGVSEEDEMERARR